MKKPSKTPKGITLQCSDKEYYLKTENIICVEATGAQVTMHLTEDDLHGKKLVLCYSMQQMETELGEEFFLRTHAHWLINMKHILERIKVNGNFFRLTNGMKPAIARSHKEEVLARMERFTASQ